MKLTSYTSSVLCALLAVTGSSARAGVLDLYNFTDGADGAVPESGLIQGPNGLLYGTAVNGGSNGFGAVFSFSPSGSLSSIYSFTGAADGSVPWGGLTLLSNGLLYGATLEGGSGFGALYQISSSGQLTPLYSFTGGNDGASPLASLTPGPDGNLYGAASSGGSNGAGTLFRLTPSGAFTLLYTFTGGSDGASPSAPLTLANGFLYGSTSSGGASSNGVLFKIDVSGNFTLLHTFSGSDGAGPVSPLAVGSDGNLYGAAFAGGSANNGSLFRLSPSGSFNLLYSFSADNTGTNADGIGPCDLIAGNDGKLYGVAVNGGLNGAGTIFSSTLAGSFSSLYSFGALSTDTDTNSDGAYPSGLLQAANGVFYGTTTSGGPDALGSIFQFSLPDALQFLAPGGVSLSNGVVTLRLNGPSASGYIIVDSSPDLKQWTPLVTNPASTSIQIQDPAAQGLSHRFYRARLASP